MPSFVSEKVKKKQKQQIIIIIKKTEALGIWQAHIEKKSAVVVEGMYRNKEKMYINIDLI